MSIHYKRLTFGIGTRGYYTLVKIALGISLLSLSRTIPAEPILKRQIKSADRCECDVVRTRSLSHLICSLDKRFFFRFTKATFDFSQRWTKPKTVKSKPGFFLSILPSDETRRRKLGLSRD